MKKICRLIAFIMLAVILVCTLLFGCGTQEKTLYNQGIEVAALMSEMASDPEYITALTGSPEVQKALQCAAAADPKSPLSVYEVIIPQEALLGLLGVENTDSMSENLKANLTARSYAAIGPQINAAGGVNNLAAASLCTAELSFLNSGFTGNTIYIYSYQNSAPVLVSFSAGQDGIVTATGCFLLGNSISSESKEEMEDYFAEFGAEIRKVNN